MPYGELVQIYFDAVAGSLSPLRAAFAKGAMHEVLPRSMGRAAKTGEEYLHHIEHEALPLFRGTSVKVALSQLPGCLR